MADKYLSYLGLDTLFGTHRTKQILHVNPTIPPQREEAKEVKVFVYDYDADSLEKHELPDVVDCNRFKENNRITWINIDGIRKSDVEKICTSYGIHLLIAEDILSINQRPK